VAPSILILFQDGLDILSPFFEVMARSTCPYILRGNPLIYEAEKLHVPYEALQLPINVKIGRLYTFFKYFQLLQNHNICCKNGLQSASPSCGGLGL